MSPKEERRAKSLQTATPLYKGVIQAAWDKTASPRGAIKAHCLQCTGFDRIEVANCQAVACALFEYRPYRVRSASEEPSGTE